MLGGHMTMFLHNYRYGVCKKEVGVRGSGKGEGRERGEEGGGAGKEDGRGRGVG